MEIRRGDRIKIGEKIPQLGLITSDIATIHGREADGRYRMHLDRDDPNPRTSHEGWEIGVRRQ